MKLSLPLTSLIHENLSIILTFAYSRQSLEALLRERFRGGWKYLQNTIFEVSEQRAIRACLELAVLLRALDDQEGLSQYVGSKFGDSIGQIVKGKSTKPMSMRDVCNKVIHAASLEWDFSNSDGRPRLICVARERETWERAEIEVQGLAAVCGGLMH